MEADERLRAQYPELGTLEAFEEWLAPKIREYQNSVHSRATTTIPVIFHIIHDNDPLGSGDNLSATYVNAQLDQLNNDFRRILGTSGYNNNPVGADSEIEFCLAMKDPSGITLAEPGVNRINRSSRGWSAPPYGTCIAGNFGDTYIENTIKPQSQWNPDDYLNIWVMDIACSILGYAQFPSSSGLGGLNNNGGASSTDGVVLLTSSLGSSTTPNPNGGVYNAGRTATHEIGHFFGLRHIWGDATCGNDYCADTPTQQGPSSGCPNTTTCDGVRDMVENYMDYSYDDCMNVFTGDQKARMQTVLANSPRRGSLGNSTACTTGGGGPSCSATISTFPYTEGFESGIGAWTQATSDDFDWTRRTGSTPSSNTGPAAAASGSYYMFVEASSPNYPSKTTIFNSPCFDLSGAANSGLTFKYHMYGATTMGDLSLQARSNGGSWTTVWSRSNNQGNSWETGTVDLNTYNGTTLELRFVGTTNSTWQGDIAIDDISLTTTSGGGGGCVGGITAFPYGEGFESSFGQWTQGSTDDFNWERRSGSTPSSNTGPSSAAAGSFYAFMESSSPNYSNKTAILNSPCFDLSGESTATFSFQYHMYGASNMGSLSLQARANGGSSWTTLWSKSSNQGNSWQTANIDLATYTGDGVELRIVGTTGTTWQGDMAIDALSLSTSGGGSGCTDVTVSITLDNYPEETSWEIRNAGNTLVASGGTYGSQPDGSTVNITECLPDGCYDFTIFDAYSDGICCAYGNGSYTVSGGGSTLASGGSFGASETTNFCLSGGNLSDENDNRASNTFQDNLDQLDCFPNPTREQLNIRYNSETEGLAQMQIVDLLGQVIRLQSWNIQPGKNEQQLDVSQLNGGTYLILIHHNGQRISQRFVVVK
ncbi:MAG: hypothetical protein DHS20C18_00640 [Saprospiraceae bacterium]|nr:MAG: hypothetical protein DHS20C18_00640 [Saprospiraceae bacterium]